jgi:pyruvate/2-oxoacid:ferredoxin oxidoreductase alpha subunit
MKNNPLIEKMDDIKTENRILKSKISEMESQLNSMSTNINSNYDGRSHVEER